MTKAHRQATQFIELMLLRVQHLEFAAAWYSPATGKVARITPGRMPCASLADFERIATWLRHQNAGGANIWVRPAASSPTSPVVMLDDLPSTLAARVVGKYQGLAVETSQGNAQTWLVCCQAMSREQRQHVARKLASLAHSDPDATSEPRWGRLPGFKQCKPGKSGWTNLLQASGPDTPELDPTPYLSDFEPADAPQGFSLPPTGGRGALPSELSATDRDEHRVEFAFACHCLRRGQPPEQITQALAERALARGKRRTQAQALGYAGKTLAAATRSLHR